MKMPKGGVFGHHAMEQMHKLVEDNNNRVQSEGQRLHIAKVKVVP